jgi:hypothetical protein
MDVTKVAIVRIEYATGGRFKLTDPQSNIPLNAVLECGHTLRFENTRELNAYLEQAGHQYDRGRQEFTVNCEDCARCEVGVQRRDERDRGTSPHRTPDGRVFFPDTRPIKVKKP